MIDLDRVLEYGDGWMPIVGRAGPDIVTRIGELHRCWGAAA